ncbi:LysR family transcriptional regulator [Rhizobium sp. NPDC090275]|uniref:LysR family transcriptional regulator n=1 Tax=Rhizobium sp. NPDC090275 TaxID=3364498 RepID=UPI00383AA166
MDIFDGNQFDELTALVAIAKHGSFNAAGRSLQRHPTIVSKRIASLEARLGVRLVERTTRRVVMTDAGSRLADQIDRATAIIGDAEQKATDGAAELQGLLRVALPAAMGRLWIAPKLPEFSRRYPGLTVEIDFAERYVDLVGENFDVAIRMGTLTDSRLVARKLGNHRIVLAASPEYITQHGMPRRPSELQHHNALVYSGPVVNPNWRFTRQGQRESISPQGTFRCNDIWTLLEMARAGVGIVCVGEWAVTRELSSGELAHVLPDWRFDGDGGIYIVRPSSQYAPARTEAFLSWIQNDVWPTLPW